MSDGDKKDEHSNSLGLGHSLFTLVVPVCFFFSSALFHFQNCPSLDNKLYSHYSHLSDKYYEKKSRKGAYVGKILIFSSMIRKCPLR